MNIWWWTLILSSASAVLYRLGGIGAPFNTKYRDFGCPACVLLWFWLAGLWSWWLILSFGLMFGALTTYWDSLSPSGEYDNFWLHGFMIGLGLLPFAWATNHWLGLAIYSVSLAITMGAWSLWISWDDLEEGGRGLFIIALLPIFLI